MDKLHDKVVGIIGTGATAVQAVPKLAEASKHLYVFQRTPSTVSERNQRDTDPEWFAEISAQPGWHDARMENFIACTTGGNPGVDMVDDGWTEMFAIDTKRQAADEAEAAELELRDFQQMERVRQRIRDTVQDPATAEKLLPWYKMHCKRPCFHDDYLPTFNRDNVTLVDTDGRGVDRITERGPVVDGVEYPVDVLVYASGFELSTFYTHRLGFDPVGEGGVSLSEAWAQGAWTLQGIFSHGFPNLCMNSAIQGGQHINIAYAATKIAQHMAWVIARSLEDGVVVQPTMEAEEDWFQMLLKTVVAYATYFATCTPGYLNNEGLPPDASGSRGAAYMRSAVEFKDLLAAWRADGTFAGLTRTPYAST
jgi:cation diffusion facilitator CzcD-associated flavoprotein CzcO